MSAFFHPAYWGALFALLVGIIATVTGYLNHQLYDVRLSELPVELAVAITFASVVISVILAIRYYFAVSLNIYSSIDRNIFALPRPLNATMFFLLCGIIFLCNGTLVIFGLFGPIWVLFLGFLINLISLSAIALMSIAYAFRPKSLSHPPVDFIVCDFLILLAIVLLVAVATFDLFDTSYEERALIAVVGASVVIFVSAHEAWKLYRRPLFEQLQLLRHRFSS